MKKLLFLLLPLILLSCSDSDDDTITTSEFPTGWFKKDNANKMWFTVENGTLYVQAYLQGISGQSNGYSANFSVTISKDNVTLVSISKDTELHFKFVEYSDRYELVYQWGRTDNRHYNIHYLPSSVFINYK